MSNIQLIMDKNTFLYAKFETWGKYCYLLVFAAIINYLLIKFT